MDDDEAVDALERLEALKADVYGAATAAGMVKASDGTWRKPSKAHLINGGPRADYPGDAYVKGSFITAVARARSADFEDQRAGKAALGELSTFLSEQDVRAFSKATLGSTDATGGWIIPNAAVDTITKAAAFKNPYANLMTFRRDVKATAVDIPFRSASPTRAAVVPGGWGGTKENLNLAYNGYTATMYTLARIYDIQNQFLRASAGAAEEDVLSELAVAFALGESFYIREGTGSSEPYGYLPAITNGPSTFRTTHTAGTSLAGSVAAAIAKAASALYGRGRIPEAAVISPLGMAELLTNGADTAGFYVSGISTDPLPNFRSGTLISPFGIPIVVDPDLSSDDLIVGEWSAFRVYMGESYRVDSSNQAGTRWDLNQTGFRGEEEIAFDGRPAVYAGALQMVTDILTA